MRKNDLVKPNPVTDTGTLVKTIPWLRKGNPLELWYCCFRERTEVPKGVTSGRETVELVESVAELSS